jgi:hypothetical protein
LEGSEETPLEVELTITSGEDLGTLTYDKDHKYYVLHANSKNKLGKIVLSATYNNKECNKTIEIIPLW